MNFTKEKVRDFYLLDSKVENIFINEYMPAAPGDYVKVFLFAQMYAEFSLDMSNEMIAKQLGIDEKMILEAWEYWEQLGAIKRHYIDSQGRVDFTVEFVNLKELMYGKVLSTAEKQKESQSKRSNVFENKAVKEMFPKIEKILGRGLDSTELERIMKWLPDYDTTPEVVLLGVSYCAEKNKTGLNYIEKVIMSWAKKGLNTVDSVKEHLQANDEKHYKYKRVFEALGFPRNPTETEKEMMDCWFDKMGFTMDRVLEACTKTAGISNPNFNYVNKVLENWKNDAEKRGNDVNKQTVVTQRVLNHYLEFLREKAEKQSEERKIEVYKKLPRIEEIDEETRKVSSQLSKALILGLNDKNGKDLKVFMDKMASERAVVLTENNFEMDYTDIKYACDKCNDTGITDLGERCSCIKQRMEEAEIWQKKRKEK